MTTEPYIYARHDTARPLARRPSPGDDERRREQRMPAEKVQMRNGGAKATVNVYIHTQEKLDELCVLCATTCRKARARIRSPRAAKTALPVGCAKRKHARRHAHAQALCVRMFRLRAYVLRSQPSRDASLCMHDIISARVYACLYLPAYICSVRAAMPTGIVLFLIPPIPLRARRSLLGCTRNASIDVLWWFLCRHFPAPAI